MRKVQSAGGVTGGGRTTGGGGVQEVEQPELNHVDDEELEPEVVEREAVEAVLAVFIAAPEEAEAALKAGPCLLLATIADLAAEAAMVVYPCSVAMIRMAINTNFMKILWPYTYPK